MRVCFLSQKFPPMPGGISRYVENVSKELTNLGVDVSVVTLRPYGCSSYEKKGHVNVYRTLTGSDLSVNLYLLTIKKLVNKINHEKTIDIIHGQLPLIQSVLLPKKTNFIETIHSISKIEIDALKNLPFIEIAAWEKYLIIFASIYRVLEKIVLTKADICITVSKHVRDKVNEVFGHHINQKMTVIPNGVNTDRFHPDIDGINMRNQFGTDQDYVYGFLGRLCGRKNIKTLILAFSLLANEDPNVKLAIGGSGDEVYTRQLIDLAQKVSAQEKIAFLGYIPEEDVPRFYAACDAIVMPSYQESFGITIIEGMASAKPIIAAQTGGIVEFVKDGETGILFDPKSPYELAKAMQKIKENQKLARNISNKARNMVEKEYSWNIVARRILKVYDLVI